MEVVNLLIVCTDVPGPSPYRDQDLGLFFLASYLERSLQKRTYSQSFPHFFRHANGRKQRKQDDAGLVCTWQFSQDSQFLLFLATSEGHSRLLSRVP